MVPRSFDFDRIVEALTDHGVKFVVIGGLAAVAQGSPFPTEDVDVTPEMTRDNLDRLSAALRDLDARIRTDAVPDGLPFDHDGESLGAAGVWNLVTPHGWLDISMVPAGTGGYADLVADARELDIMGIQVRVASLADVIRSKQAANRAKDQRVLPTLREILANRDLDTK
ncbi:hypothetical protein [Nocardioides halotolerans]|jgi:hypothetical protein|uniref:hypothetical protein n=1 Tax=Nocardioides halotolerans TaxID=433660 RepID=UPI0012F9520A|nr:hypothetical protein [Nocardioides halotolerans]